MNFVGIRKQKRGARRYNERNPMERCVELWMTPGPPHPKNKSRHSIQELPF
jgi:hypothetical protein